MANEDRSAPIQNGAPKPPGIAAAFYVKFDVRKGYTIVWQKSLDGLRLDGIVDYKSLPSGLHHVDQDLVYFIDGEYAGISAFLNKLDSASERNARMLAVGVLVPLEQGRMGKSWRHAEGLKDLARAQMEHPDDFQSLEKYWSDYQLSDESKGDESPADLTSDVSLRKGLAKSVNGYRSSHRISTVGVPNGQGQLLSPYHPALSLPSMLQSFGPLIFPLFRAALLRKRILLVSEAPVELACNFVYDISLLSTFPASLAELLPVDGSPNFRLKPLFNVGVPDIPELSIHKNPHSSPADLDCGWVACTTDDVIATKPELFDLLVFLPSPDSPRANPKSYPKLVPSSPELSRTFPKSGLRATQRDARQYLRLRAGLANLPNGKENRDTPDVVSEEAATRSIQSEAPSTLSQKSVVEPPSWPRIAYTSLVWWASAGEKRLGLTEEEDREAEQDARLLDAGGEDETTKEVTMVAYFHRLTSLIFSTVSDAIARADGEDYRDGGGDEDEENEADESALAESREDLTAAEGEGGETEALIRPQPKSDEPPSEVADEDVDISEDDMRAMALDVWSVRDREFVEELVALWWGRKAVVRGGRIECCGIRIL